MGVVSNPVHVFVYPLCAHNCALFQSREGDWDCFVAVLPSISLSHGKIKGNERHLGGVFSVSLLSLLRH